MNNSVLSRTPSSGTHRSNVRSSPPSPVIGSDLEGWRLSGLRLAGLRLVSAGELDTGELKKAGFNIERPFVLFSGPFFWALFLGLFLGGKGGIMGMGLSGISLRVELLSTRVDAVLERGRLERGRLERLTAKGIAARVLQQSLKGSLGAFGCVGSLK